MTLVQADFVTDVTHIERTKNATFCNANRVKLPVQFRLPEVQELVQDRELWIQVELLPDKCLEELWMVRHVIENFRRRKAVSLEHQVNLGHVLLPQMLRQTRSSVARACGLDASTGLSVLRTHEAIVDTSSRLRREAECHDHAERVLNEDDCAEGATVISYAGNSCTSAHHV